MFLASASDFKSQYYQSPNVPDRETDNINVCIGLYSGADSNYSSYRSNCFDLMVSRCSLEWSKDCDLYIKTLPYGQVDLFHQTIRSRKIPLSTVQNCRLSSQPYFPRERVVMGANTFQMEDGTYYPTPCHQSTFLEHKRKEFELNYEKEKKLQTKRDEMNAIIDNRLQKERKIQQESPPVYNELDKPQSPIEEVQFNHNVQFNNPVEFNKPVQFNHPIQATPVPPQNTSEKEDEFYKLLVNPVKTDCAKTCTVPP